MSWGLPPKYEIVHTFRDVELDTINQSVVNALDNFDFTVETNSTYMIVAIKKMPITFMSFFSFSRPHIKLNVLITKKGRIKVKSVYNYNSRHGITMNDRGKQKDILDKLLLEIIDLTARNHEFNTFGTVDGEKQ